ncbi:ABC transporter substrate-binding protein [Desulfosarcina variabilis]|uniref:ABC transporter substrate-binding protein n=1 Tax=Desulfosarcina variabilis TaxID=2300 RepID=UPI003AFA2B9B
MKIRTLKSTLFYFWLTAFGFLFANPLGIVGVALGEPAHFLRFGVHVSEMGNLDPHFAAGSQDRALADMVFNGLLRYQPGNAPVIEPDLAEAIPHFKMVDDHQVWTVKLRKGVWFHAGPGVAAHELTADDVVFSLQKSADPDFCAYAGEYAGLTVMAVDRYTVRITLDRPLSAILFLPKLTNYAGGFIVSRKAIKTMGYQGFKKHPIGTGPFFFEDYKPGQNLVLKAHQRYFRGRPLLAGVEFSFIPEVDQREAGLNAGTLDVIMGSGEKGWLEKMAAQPGVLIDTHGVGEVATLYLNTCQKPLDDIRVRRAIAFALNRQAFLDTVSDQLAGEVYSPVPDPFLPGGISKADAEKLFLFYRNDLERARQLMRAAGYANGFALDLVTSEKRLYRVYYEEMRRQLARIDIRCHISVVSHSKMHALIRQTALPMVIYVAWRPNADAYLSRFFHSNAIIITGARPDTNFSHYRNIDPLIEAARIEIDPKRQIQLWEQAQIRILDDMAAYPIMYTKQCYARRAGVKYGHTLVSTMALYPQFTERTCLQSVP